MQEKKNKRETYAITETSNLQLREYLFHIKTRILIKLIKTNTIKENMFHQTSCNSQGV